MQASPKAISRRTSYLRVRLEFLPYPHLIATLFNGCACGPPKPFTAPSSWTWVDHPVSGLRYVTLRPFKTWFPFGCLRPRISPCRVPQLAGPFYKKYAVALPRVALPPVVNTGFQVLFHSPPGVLFTFPSRYCFAVPPISHKVSRVSWYSGSCSYLSLTPTGLSPSSAGFPKTVPVHLRYLVQSITPESKLPGLGSSAFARRYSRNRCFFLFLWVLRCFSSPGSPAYAMDLRMHA